MQGNVAQVVVVSKEIWHARRSRPIWELSLCAGGNNRCHLRTGRSSFIQPYCLMRTTDFSIGYCTNVHAGATLDVTRANLEKHAVAVKQRFSPERPMGVGLWLSANAAAQLVAAQGESQFRDWLAERGLVPYTLNGFPYGDFHQ